MDFHGHINLRENEMRKMAFDAEVDFPASPVVGRMVFKNFTLYMCVDLNGILPIWIPITNTISTHIHTQSVAATTWTVDHKLGTDSPVVQVYDENDQLMIADDIAVISTSRVEVTVSTAITGKVIVMGGDIMPVDGVGVLAPEQLAYTENVSGSATYVVKHNLGYYPIVRAFVGTEEIHPTSVTHDSIFQTTVTFSVSTNANLRLT